MAQIPGIFNAAQYFGNSSPKKGQQETFWDQQPSNISGPAEYHHPFNGNTSAAVDPFMTSGTQNEFDGWDEWPTDELEDGFFDNDSSHPQNHVGPSPYYDPASPHPQLVVPENDQYQEDLTESSNSSSMDSSPGGMDPELNDAWVEEETPSYAFSKFPPDVIPSGQAPQTAASLSSGADFFDGHFNGDTEMQQPEMGEEHSTSNGPTYASVCQAGLPVAPLQDYPPQTQEYFPEQLHAAPPTSDAAGAQDELLNPQDNELGVDSWSREPELGSWSPVFNHQDDSFASNQQFTSDSTVPQIDESTWKNTSSFQPGVDFGALPQQNVPPTSLFAPDRQAEMPAEVPPQVQPGQVPELTPADASQMQSYDDDGSVLAQMHSHDEDSSASPFNNTAFADNQQVASEPSVPQTDESMWTVNASSSSFQPGFDTTAQQVPAFLPQNQLFAGEMDNFNTQLPPYGGEVQSSFYNETAVANSQPELFAGNQGYYSEDMNNTPQLYHPEEVPPLFGPGAVEEEATMDQAASVQADPFAVESMHADDFPEEAPVSHQDFFEDDTQEAPEEGISELLGNLQPGAFTGSSSMGDVMLPRGDLEPTLQEQSGEFLSSLTPQAVQPAFPQDSFQQDEPLQCVGDNVPSDHYVHDSLPADEKPLAGPLGHKPLSMDSPSGTFTPKSAVEPMQPPSVGHVPLEQTPTGLFMPDSVEQTKLQDTESSPSAADQSQQESVPEAAVQASFDERSLVEEPDSPRDAIQAAYRQKQLAGKAPASSPRTSLWMNSTPLTAPCMLAPAAVEPSGLPKNDQAPLAGPLPAMSLAAPFLPAPVPVAATETSQLFRNEPAPPAASPAAAPVASVEPSQQQSNIQPPPAAPLPAVPMMTPFVPASTPVASTESSQQHSNVQAPPAAPLPAVPMMTPFVPASTPVASAESSQQHSNVQAPPAAPLPAVPMMTPFVPGPAPVVTSVSLPQDVQAPPAPLQPAVPLFTPSLPVAAPVAEAQPSQLHKDDQALPAAPPTGTVQTAPSVLPPVPVTMAGPPMLCHNEQTPLAPPPTAPSVLPPVPVTTAEQSVLRHNEQTPVPAPPMASSMLPPPSVTMAEQPMFHNQAPPASAPMQATEAPLPPKVTPFTPQVRETAKVQTTPGQLTESISAPPKTAPMQSLASLLQGGKGRPKKKTSAPSPQADVGSTQNANLPPRDSTSSSQSGVPPSNTVQETSYSADQRMDDQSFDSVERTGQRHETPNESDYHDPYSRSRDYPYYDQDRRDRYFERQDYEYDRRDRRDLERRDRGELDRRYHTREYETRDFGSKDLDRRDSYDRRDPYYGYGSPRQSRRDYNDRRTSREDLYRSQDQGYAHSYHSGRSTPSSDYDYSSSSYAQHQQYSYPSSYADSQSMYQYLTMLYYYYPQHYEQYCAQQGYYNMGYTPEQMAQFYGMPYPSEYDASQQEQVADAEVQESDPARLTPLLYRVQHPFVRFSGGMLVSLISSEDEEEQPKCVIASVQMVFSVEEIEIIKAFPGPLSSMYSSRTEVISYCEQRSVVTDTSADGLVKSLTWKILANLVKHSGAFVASDLAEIIMENWRSCNKSSENEFLSAESGLPTSENERSKHLSLFREMLLAGATKDALEYAMRYSLWGHAMMLASKMDKKVQNEVTSRFMKTMTDFDPIRTVYDHLSGRQPVALLTPDDWQRNLAAMVANPPRQQPHSNKKNMICLGDTLMTNDQVWAAHLCYTLAGERFGYPSDEKTKMALLGVDHRKTTITGQNIPLENLQMMEVLEYALSLNNEDHFIPVLQTYKYLHANKLAEAGFTEEALHYADLIGRVLIKHPHHLNTCLAKNVRELTDRLNPDAQDAAAAEMTEMLDRLLQAKDSSQISSSVTESEGEVEDPLAESSASFFSGYNPGNTHDHQVDKTEDVLPQDSWSEPALSDPAVSQDFMGDVHKDSRSGTMDAQDSQFPPPQQLPPVEQLPPSTGLQPPGPWAESSPAVDSPLQVPFFVPGPPVAQELPGQMESEQPAAMEEQPFYNQQSLWNGNQQQSWNENQQPSWSEEVKREEPKKVEPPLMKEPEPPVKEEPKPKPSEKAKKKANSSNQGGWLSGLSGIIQKVIPRGPNEMILPDDKKKTIYWDEDLKKWVNTEEDEQENAPLPPPPTDMQLGAGMPPPMPPPMPLGHGTPVNGGNAMKGVGGRAAGAPHMTTPPVSPRGSSGMAPAGMAPSGMAPAGMAPSGMAPSGMTPSGMAPSGMPLPGMTTSPVASRFSRKARGGLRNAKRYVDVLNPNGQSSSNAVLPSNLLPMMPSTEFKGSFFVPSPVTTDTSDERTDGQVIDQPPAIGNPSSRPSSRNEVEDGGEQQSQHSRSSSASLTSAEVRSYMMPQDPDPPPQAVPAAPVLFDPARFSQPQAQGSPRKPRYPHMRKN